MLTLLTPTGDRQHAFDLCQKYMARQTYDGPVKWIIVDDGVVPTKVGPVRAGWQTYVARLPAAPGVNTQARNMLEGLALVGEHDRLVVIEDDDRYATGWLAEVDRHLNGADLVGETRARYYNVATKQARQLNNSMHASLCATAIKGAAIHTLKSACNRGSKFIDMDLWRTYRGKKVLISSHMVVGIKGMPGRRGIGMGHRPESGWLNDQNGAILREWIGDDAEYYL